MVESSLNKPMFCTGISEAMDKIKVIWSKTNRWHLSFLIFLIIELRWIPGGMVGFMCKDPALSHEYTGDTITAKHLFGTIFLLPLAVLLLVERTYHRDSNDKSRQALRWYKEYMFGLLINLIIIESLKVFIGSPRPHFFDTCSPKEAVSCVESEYVSQYTCTKSHWLQQSNTSFPSGHTALGVHAGFFLIYYLHRRARRSNAILLAQIVLSAVAIICGVSRMMDHRHHWWDVLAGAVLGLPSLIYTVYLCNNFDLPEEKELQPNSIENNTNTSTPLVNFKDT